MLARPLYRALSLSFWFELDPYQSDALLLAAKYGLRARSGISCAFGRRIRDAMLGAKRAVWLCHTNDSQQRRAPEAGEPNVQVISERALTPEESPL